MTQQSRIRYLPNNLRGNDYVVGDVHGCVDLLLRLLVEVKFDTSKDRLFAVGDLIDRGPHSLACLILSSRSWFYSVQGNHEAMMLQFFSHYLQTGRIENMNDIHQTGFLSYGGDWVISYFRPERQAMTDEFNQGLLLALAMPLIWVVGEGCNRFHVIHAELHRPGSWQSNEPVWLDSDIDQWLKNQVLAKKVEGSLYWSRTIANKSQRKLLPTLQQGLSTTFCGHTYDEHPRQTLSHICLDTGAFQTQWSESELTLEEQKVSGLTLFDIKESYWITVSYQTQECIKGDFAMT
jgi:serine/threonine protein phosphatase 1